MIRFSPLRLSPFSLTPAEAWKVVPGFSGYSASTLGRIRDDLTGRVLRQSVASHGYRQVGLRIEEGRRSLPVHQLVAAAWLGHCPPGLEVDHVNGDVRDNAARNLAYVTHKENMRRAAARGQLARGDRLPQTKLTPEAVRAIRATPKRRGSLTGLARRYGVSTRAVAQVLERRSWDWVD